MTISSLMMEAARISETSVDNYFTRKYIPEDNSELHTRRRENLKSHMITILLMIVITWPVWRPRNSRTLRRRTRKLHKTNRLVRCHVLTAESLKMTFFCNAGPCSPIESDTHFGSAYCLYHHGNRPLTHWSTFTRLQGSTSQKIVFSICDSLLFFYDPQKITWSVTLFHISLYY
jgi:hypothetical protein